jgi:hypothetical protein
LRVLHASCMSWWTSGLWRCCGGIHFPCGKWKLWGLFNKAHQRRVSFSTASRRDSIQYEAPGADFQLLKLEWQKVTDKVMEITDVSVSLLHVHQVTRNSEIQFNNILKSCTDVFALWGEILHSAETTFLWNFIL